MQPTPVAEAAGRLELPSHEVQTVREGDGRDALAETSPDALVVVAYGELLPPDIRSLARLGAVNVHFSLLPAWRGAGPVRAAIAAGESVTGVTTMQLDDGMDTGPILLQREEPIRDDDDAASLGARLAEIGADLLVETLSSLDELTPTAQDPAAATHAPKLAAADRLIDWSRSAEQISWQVRSLAPDPGATTRFRGHGLKILEVGAEPGSATESPGTIIATGNDGFSVAAGTGLVRLVRLGPSGRSRMSGAEFVRGYAPRVGERFD